jgi:membrane-bound serine protease (ClpP class)
VDWINSSASRLGRDASPRRPQKCAMKNLLTASILPLLMCGDVFAVQEGAVVVVPVQREITKAQFIFLRRAVKEAERADAAAVVLDMDTYGGELEAATRMLDVLFNTSLPTYTYINKNAGSAGALIALGTRHIYMAPVSAIGAAAPVIGGGGDLPETMSEKVISYFAKYFRSAAERNNHNPDIAEAFINKNKEVKIGDIVINEKGSLLSLSAQEATRIIDGKPLLAEGIADSLKDLVEKAKLPQVIERIEPTGFERIAFWITALAPLFLLGGIVGTYIEMKTPGFGVPGFVAAACFLIFFTGHYVAGLAGLEVLGVFLLGVLLVLLELFLIPGSIIAGAVGATLILASLLWAMVDRYPRQPLVPKNPELFLVPLMNMGLAAILAAVVITFLVRFLPGTSLYRRLVLGSAIDQGAALPSNSAHPTIVAGMEGVAMTPLRPSGKAQFGDLILDVVTFGEFIERNAPVRIAQVEGSRVVVECLPEFQPTQSPRKVT